MQDTITWRIVLPYDLAGVFVHGDKTGSLWRGIFSSLRPLEVSSKTRSSQMTG